MNPHAVRKGGTHQTDETVEREGELSVFGFISLYFNSGGQGIMEKVIRKFLNSTLSSVYVTTESHEKCMHVAGQCALRFAGKIHVVSYFCFKILGNLKHRRFISMFYTWKGR